MEKPFVDIKFHADAISLSSGSHTVVGHVCKISSLSLFMIPDNPNYHLILVT